MNLQQMAAQKRDWMNKNSGTVTLVAVIFLMLALVAIGRSIGIGPGPTPPEIDGYYYDVDTDKVFISRVNSLPPIVVPGSAAGAKATGARAFVFACKDCGDEKDRYVGWIELYTPEAKAAMSAGTTEGGAGVPLGPASMMGMERGHMIAKPDPQRADWKKEFYEFMSNEGNRIMQESQARCGEGVIPRNCMPADADKKK